MTPIEERLAPFELQILGIYFALFIAGCIAIRVYVRERWRKAATDWPAIVLRISCRPWSVLDAAIIIGLLAILNLAFAFLLRHMYPPEEDFAVPGHFPVIVTGMVLTHGAMLAAIFSYVFIKRVKLRSAFGGGSHRFLTDVGTGTIGFLSMIVVVVPAMMATGLILKALHREEKTQEIISIFSMQNGVLRRVFFSVWTVLVAPVAEEMLFRGILLPLALRKFSPLVAILLVSTGFAYIHLNVTAFLPLIAVSTSLCLAFMATESIVVCITMHALFNALTTTFVLLA